MKIAFIIQSEGRGHLTQAMAMNEMLIRNGHQVIGIFVGGSGKPLPVFFSEAIQAPIYQLKSPYLIFKGKALSLWATTQNIIRFLFDYIRSLKILNQNLTKLQPDLILNFYEVLGGFHQQFYQPIAPMICIGHQYLLLHPNFEHPEGWLHRLIINSNTRLTSLKAKKMMALSFDKKPNSNQIVVVPPLIRSKVLALKASRQNFLLVYLTNAALAQEIIDWQSKNLSVKIVGFWDNATTTINENLVFNALDGSLFLEKLSQCRGLITTAGFESVCEAMFLNKPVMMVPVPNHYEQACNAKDGQRIGAGISNKFFDIDKFESYLQNHQNIEPIFKEWINAAEKIILDEMI